MFIFKLIGLSVFIALAGLGLMVVAVCVVMWLRHRRYLSTIRSYRDTQGMNP